MEPFTNRSLEDMEGEVWKDVVGQEGKFQVSNLGRVKSLTRKVNTWNSYKTLPTIILSQDHRNGYARCKVDAVHRLVARAFIPTDDPALHVNHKNGVRDDNRVENLEWCTPAENAQHAWATGLCNDGTRAKMSAKAKLRTGTKNPCWRGYVEILDMENNLIHTVVSLKDAVAWITENTQFKKAAKSSISRVCTGELKQTYGYKFRYNRG